jgi:hypothetical protein
MGVFELDPIHASRWAAFVDRNPRALIFHTVGWLKALGTVLPLWSDRIHNLLTRGRVAKWLDVFAAYEPG